MLAILAQATLIRIPICEDRTCLTNIQSGTRQISVNRSFDLEVLAELPGWWTSASMDFLQSRRVPSMAYVDIQTIQETVSRGTSGRQSFGFLGYLVKVRIDSAMFYPSCGLEKNGRLCQKKVREEPNGSFTCPTCLAPVVKPVLLYNLNVVLKDSTGTLEARVFSPHAQTLMNQVTPEELSEVLATRRPNNPELQAYTNKPLYQFWDFRVTVSENYFQDELKLNYTVSSLKPVNMVEHGKRLGRELVG